MDRDAIRASSVILSPVAVVCAASVEHHATVADAAAFDLDSDQVAIRRGKRREVECEPLTERNQRRYIRSCECREYRRLGRISAVDGFHESTVAVGSDEQMFALRRR
jgi:hypothetical protein